MFRNHNLEDMFIDIEALATTLYFYVWIPNDQVYTRVWSHPRTVYSHLASVAKNHVVLLHFQFSRAATIIHTK